MFNLTEQAGCRGQAHAQDVAPPVDARGYVLIVIRGRKRELAVKATGEQELAAEAAG